MVRRGVADGDDGHSDSKIVSVDRPNNEKANEDDYSIKESHDRLDGAYGGVIRDSAGNLYGTTFGGGTEFYGVVYKLKP